MGYLGLWKKNPQWREEERELLQNVTSVEPFMESVPQIFWLIFISITTRCLGFGNYDPLAISTFVTSVISATYALTNFLRVGPLKVVSNKIGSGFGHLSFWLIIFSIATSLVAKGCTLAFVLTAGPGRERPQYALYTLLANCLPQLILSFVALTMSVGFKGFVKIFTTYPATLILPVFTPFTFGPKNSTLPCASSKTLRLHYGFTVLNLVISAVGMGFSDLFIGRSDTLYRDGLNNTVWIRKLDLNIITLPIYSLTIFFTTFLILSDGSKNLHSDSTFKFIPKIFQSCFCFIPVSKHSPVRINYELKEESESQSNREVVEIV